MKRKVVFLLFFPLLALSFLPAFAEFELRLPPSRLLDFSLSMDITNRVLYTNIILTNDQTLEEITNSNSVIHLPDPFPPLCDWLWEAEEYADFSVWSIPNEELLIPRSVESKKAREKRVRSLGDQLPDLSEPLYSETLFEKYFMRKLRGKMQFTPEEQKHLALGFEEWDTKVIVSGWVNLKAGYGWVVKNESYSEAIPGVSQGFTLDQDMKIGIVGKIGERVSVSIDHSSDNPENLYELAFKALDTDTGSLRELRAGNIALSLPLSSYYLKYSGTSKESYGVKSVFQFGDVTWQSILNLTSSQQGHKSFTGSKQTTTLSLPETSYIKRKYFILPDTGIDTNFVLYASTTNSTTADKKIDSAYFRKLYPGSDYVLNRATGELTLSNASARGIDLAVRYTAAGSAMNTSGGSTGTDANNGDTYLYLWKATNDFSPYQHCGYYTLSQKNLDLSAGFTLKVVYTSDTSRQASFQFTSEDYTLGALAGSLKFNSTLPFPDSSGVIYSNSQDPTSANSTYTMLITYTANVKSYQLDYGVVSGSERVYINGKLLASSEYKVDSDLGLLTFNQARLINNNDQIEVYYEYKPFYTGSQKFGAATRLDYKPNKAFNIGTTAVYSVAQRDEEAPSIGTSAEGLFMGNIDSSFNAAEWLKIADQWELSLKGEAAVSVFDPNSAGVARVEDFEDISDGFSFNKTENRWILASPPSALSNLNQTNRGKLLYRDYRSYNLDGSFSLVHYSRALSADQIFDYSEKPGPYNALGGHLSPADYPNLSQSSLIFDYDFRNGGEWVGAVLPFSGGSGIDFSEYEEVSFWVRMEGDEDGDNTYDASGTSEVEFYIGVGTLNEDSDGDGILDAEATRSQAGYPFNSAADPSSIETYIGRGRKGGGDNYRQTEDLNLNDSLDTNESLVLFPSAAATENTNAGISCGEFRKVSFSIKSLDSDTLSALSHAQALSVYIRRGTGYKGRLIIDSLEFKKVGWQTKRVDGIEDPESTALRAESISVYQNPAYAAHRFYDVSSSDSDSIERADLFEKLHGSRSISEAQELNEKALSLIYSLSNVPLSTNSAPYTGGTNAWIIKSFSKTVSFAAYHTLKWYVYVPSSDDTGASYKSADDTDTNEAFFLRLGSSDNTYFEWRIPVNRISKDCWVPMEIQISNNLKLTVDGQENSAYSTPLQSGNPHLAGVTMMSLGVAVLNTAEALNRGEIWIDEIHVSGDKTTTDGAYYVSARAASKKPLLTLYGVEVIGPASMESRYEAQGTGFTGDSADNIGTGNSGFTFNSQIGFLRDGQMSVTYQNKNSGTTTNTNDLPLYLQSQTSNSSLKGVIAYNGKGILPVISHAYTETRDSSLTHPLITESSTDTMVYLPEVEFENALSFAYAQQIVGESNRWSIRPELRLEDSLSIYDQSAFTNRDVPVFISNSLSSAIRSHKKMLNTGLNMQFWALTMNGNFIRSAEKMAAEADGTGYRDIEQEWENAGVGLRYYDRLKSIFQGFYFPDEPFDRANSEEWKIGLNMKTNSILPFLSLSLQDSLTRSADSFGYDTNDLMTSRPESYVSVSDLIMKFYIRYFVDTMQLRIKRDAKLGYNSVDYPLSYQDFLNTFGQAYYYPPFYYTAFWGLAGPRTNALEMVKNFSESDYNSASQLKDSFSADIRLQELDPFWRQVLPQQYTYTSLLTSGRNLSSYYQTLENQFDTAWTLKPSLWGWSFLSNVGERRVYDLKLDFQYKNSLNFSTRAASDTFQIGAEESIFLSKESSTAYSYKLAFKKTRASLALEDYETAYGFQEADSALSGLSKLTHTATALFNWSVTNVTEIDLWLVKLKLEKGRIQNRETLTLTAENYLHEGTVFDDYLQKLFEITYDHTSQFQFTDYFTATLLFKAVVNQYANVYASGDTIVRTDLPVGFGLQISIDARIAF